MNQSALLSRRTILASPRRAPVSKPATKWGGKLLLTVFLLTIFEGAARKWLFQSTPILRYAAYFSKDLVFLLAACAGAASISRRLQKYFGFVFVVGCLFILLPSTMNLATTPLVGAILSFRAY